MKKAYNKNIQLRCIVCGSDSDFEFNDNKTYIKCKKCNREYEGGYDELVELNRRLISQEIEQMKEDVTNDLQKELSEMFKNAFKGNKYFKLK